MMISAAEKLKRQKAVDFARGNSLFEGIELDDRLEELNQLYINGELTIQQYGDLGRAYLNSGVKS